MPYKSNEQNARFAVGQGLFKRLSIRITQLVQLLIAYSIEICRRLWQGVRIFCAQGEIAGIRYLVEANFNICERIFWSLMLCGVFSMAFHGVWVSLDYYKTNAFQLVIEDQPQFESLPFPAIFVCEANSHFRNNTFKQAFKDLKMDFEPFEGNIDFRNLMRALTYPVYHRDNNQTFKKFLNQSLEAGDFEFFNNLNYEDLIDEIYGKCEELFHECFWLGKPFKCCDYFRPLKSLTYKCFTINSKQIENGMKFGMNVTKFILDPEVKLVMNEEVTVFVLSQEEIPLSIISNAWIPKVKLGSHSHFSFVFTITVNDPECLELDITLIRCIPSNIHAKNYLTTYKLLSFGSCVTDCIRIMQWRNCGCISHMLYEGDGEVRAPYCDLKGYECLERNHLYSVFEVEKFIIEGCDKCLPVCEENSINDAIIVTTENSENTKDKAKVSIFLKLFPQNRTRRQIVRSQLDMMVMLCGIFSLLTGFSLVHIIELIFCIVCAIFRPNLLV